MITRPWPPSLVEEWRRRRGLSGAALARQVGVSRQHVSRIESGHTRPSPRMRRALSQALGVPEEVLFETGTSEH
jgi:transcriptional regulator with XRE-family HTH domain